MKTAKRQKSKKQSCSVDVHHVDVDLGAVVNHLQDWMAAGTVMEFHPGQMLFYRGHKPYGVYIVLSGRVKLVRNHGDSNKDDFEFRNMPVGYTVGFDLILCDTVYPCTALAEDHVKALFVSRSNILSWFEDQKKFDV